MPLEANEFMRLYNKNRTKLDLKKQYITPLQAAEKLRVCEETIRRKCRTGEIEAEKFGNNWRIPV